MRLPFFIARRYFVSKKSQRAINIISMISVAGVLVGTAALVIVLSVFNGFEDLILRLYDSFDPDIRIESVRGKDFRIDKFPLQQLERDPDVLKAFPVIEENALARYEDRQYIVTLKGIDAAFSEHTGIDTMMTEGVCEIQRGDTDFALIGAGVAYGLQLHVGDIGGGLELYGPKRVEGSLLDPEQAFNRRYITPSGVFAVQQEFDTRYVLVPYRFAQEIFEYDSQATSVEVIVKKGADAEGAAERIAATVGPDFTVKDRLRQHETVYRIMKSEKWAVFLILTFILVIATFNIIGSISMLVIEKKKDIAVMHSFGADLPLLRRIFLTEGLFINLIGSTSGMLIGWLVCLGQQRYGWVSLSGDGSFVIDAYPVKMEALDFLFVFLTVSTIGLFAAWYPAKRMVAQSLDLRRVTSDE
ncbi:MAG: hypothetical protein RL213_977 [Bacteroidota bacterium]|jgi:lipoprotein-releasing system permease protein